MIHNIAIKIVNSLSKYGSAQKKRDVNIYGTECFINETICNFLLFGICNTTTSGMARIHMAHFFFVHPHSSRWLLCSLSLVKNPIKFLDTNLLVMQTYCYNLHLESSVYYENPLLLFSHSS